MKGVIPGRFDNQRTLSVIIPAHNEEQNVKPLLLQFDELLASLPYEADVVFVDDGSHDNTLAIVQAMQNSYSWLQVLYHPTNQGLTAALETGIKNSNGNILCFYPADLQYHANDIHRLVEPILNGVDMVTGWRQGKYGIRRAGSYLYNLLSRACLGVCVHDQNCIKAFSREVAGCFVYRDRWHSFFVALAAFEGYEISEIQVRLYPRRRGKSKARFRRLPLGLLAFFQVVRYLRNKKQVDSGNDHLKLA